MSNIKKTKGLAEISSIILMVVLVILLVIIVYSPIKKMIESPLLSPELCIDMKNERIFSIIDACYSNLTRSLEIEIAKNNEEDIRSLEFQLEFDNETLSWQCGQECSKCKVLSKGEKTYHLLSDKTPQTLKMIADNCELITLEVNPCKV